MPKGFSVLPCSNLECTLFPGGKRPFMSYLLENPCYPHFTFFPPQLYTSRAFLYCARQETADFCGAADLVRRRPVCSVTI